MKEALFTLFISLFTTAASFAQYWTPATPTYSGRMEFCLNETMFLDTIAHPDSLKSSEPHRNQFFYVYDTASCPMSIASDLNTAGVEQQQLNFSSDVPYGVPFDVYIRAVRVWKPDSVNLHIVYSDSCLKLTLRADTLPMPELPDDRTITEGDSVTLTIKNYHRIMWSTGDTVPSVVVKDSGMYWVETFSEIGCRGNDTFKLSIEQPTGLTPITTNPSLAAFPNPNPGVFKVTTDQPTKFRVLTTTGQTVAQFTVPIGSTEVEISYLHSGIYVLLDTKTGAFLRVMVEE